MFMNLHSILALLTIFVLSFLIFSKQPGGFHRLDKATELSFFLSLALSLFWLVRSLKDISDPALVGPALSFCLLLMLYASILRIVVLVSGTRKKG